MFWKRQFPIMITAFVAVVMIVAYFIPKPGFAGTRDNLQQWFLIVVTFTMVLGLLNLFFVSLHKARKGRKEDRFYNWVTIVALLGTIAAGFLKGGINSPAFDFIFNYVYIPLSATIFSLLAFYVASASFRAFRAKSVMATILLITAFIVMLGRVPLGDWVTGWAQGTSLDFLYLPNITNWIMEVMNMAGQRAVLMGAALGLIATGIKIILGIERSYLGGE
ncbi:MAG TPA: hypothetical protein PLF44_07170 [Candidatus Mcinerneyibacteriales bacterium]|nr:hypothetical protein [Candidatus Mcinerneyibacteriota bacterium]HPJ70643.1 hypothetical protein [Candidatus Mcinerneyibacteriales bacterium]HPQ88657.1 hypothetical protein [Candidatus Mcinerneyibacteriales bacterium]